MKKGVIFMENKKIEDELLNIIIGLALILTIIGLIIGYFNSMELILWPIIIGCKVLALYEVHNKRTKIEEEF